ncbi:hypothetical protein VP01_7g28 [Puccinia sorghi]|uniref:Uncharacterized protein n=1 Tax=Puccinia sorghi TaxID=27349 RepID=A0A0L6UAJ9_9BASI|nr:hypothetical protein VP01_7g28 [Puccinia sorghi]
MCPGCNQRNLIEQIGIPARTGQHPPLFNMDRTAPNLGSSRQSPQLSNTDQNVSASRDAELAPQDSVELRDEEDHIHPPEDIAPQDTGKLLGKNHEDVITHSKQRRARARLESATQEKVKQLDLDQLRKKVVHHAKYKRLNIDDCVALDEAYHDVQKRHQIAVKQLLGATNYNNVCEYNVVARRFFYNCSQCREKREVERPGTSAPPTTQQKKKMSCKFCSAETERWSSKVILDLKNLGTAHHVEEGILILVKPGLDGQPPMIISGGSPLGIQFLDMFSKEMDPFAAFLSFVSGQDVIRKASGQEPVVVVSRKRTEGKEDFDKCKYDLGDKTENHITVREKLNNLIAKDSQNPTEKWPGNTEKGLAKLGLNLRIKSGNPAGINCRDFVGRPADMQNGQLQRILTAFGEGWVELLGSSRAPAPTNLGAVLGGKWSHCKEVSSPAAEGSPSSVPEGSPSSVHEQDLRKKNESKVPMVLATLPPQLLLAKHFQILLPQM